MGEKPTVSIARTSSYVSTGSGDPYKAYVTRHAMSDEKLTPYGIYIVWVFRVFVLVWSALIHFLPLVENAGR